MENNLDLEYKELEKWIQDPNSDPVNLTDGAKIFLDKIASLSRQEFNELIKSVAMARYYKKRFEEGIRTSLIRDEIVSKFKFKNASQPSLFFNSRELRTQIENKH